MQLQPFSAFATTRDVAPGEEATGLDGRIHIRGRGFTDVVESEDARLAGVNRPVLSIDLDPRNGGGRVWGEFELEVAAGGGWRGALVGEIVGGLVKAEGLAAGSGKRSGWVMRVEFAQVPAHPGVAPCPEPKAFFAMSGLLMPDG